MPTPRQKMAQVIYRLLTDPRGLSCKQLQAELGVNDRAFRDFLSELKEIPELFDDNGKTLVEVSGQGDDRRVYLRPVSFEDDNTGGHLISLQFALSMLRFLQGTELEEHLNRLLDTVHKGPGRNTFINLDRKLYSINEWPKDYSKKPKVLRDCIHSLTYGKTLKIHYKAPHKDRPTSHELNIYTLLQYRNGLYLIGKTEKGDTILLFALERITKTEKTGKKFQYPGNYSPANYIDGAFGLIRSTDEKYDVVINFEKGLEEVITARKWHKTAKTKKLRDGTIQLSMTVTALEQVVPWVLSFGSLAKVLKPKELKKTIKEEIRALAKGYNLK